MPTPCTHAWADKLPEPAVKLRGREQSPDRRDAFIKPSGRGWAEDQEAQVFMSRPTGPRNPSPLAGSPRPLSTPPGLIRLAPPQSSLGAEEMRGPSGGSLGRESRSGHPRTELTTPSFVPGVVPEPTVQRTQDETAERTGRPETRLLPESAAHASAGWPLGRV